MMKERIKVLKEIDELTTDMSKIDFILDEQFKISAIEINPELEETILITAGCHGNEPAPIYATKEFLENKYFPKNKRIVLVPYVNPTGFILNSENTREGININRDFKETSISKETNVLKEIVRKYKPEFAINLHEDPDETDFYIWVEGKTYEIKAKELISKLGISYFKNKDIHGYKVEEGIILDAKGHASFEDYLIRKNIPNFCTETPGEWTLEKRIKVNLDILNQLVR